MRHKTPRIELYYLMALSAVSAIFSTTVMAQSGKDPKQIYYTGDGNVDLPSGTFLYSNTDITIGPSPDEGGLALIRYSGVRNRGVAGADVGHALEAYIYRKRYRYEPQGEGMFNYRYHILSGRYSAMFNKDYSAIGLEASDPREGTLTWAGPDGPFVHTTRAGVIINYAAVGPKCGVAQFSTYVCATASKVTYPNGVTLDYTYQTFAGMPRPTWIRTNRGFALGMEYDGNGLLTKVCAVNLAITAVSENASCPVGSRATTYTYTLSGGLVHGSTFTDPAGATTTYTYTYPFGGTNPTGTLGSIQSPGSSAPDLTIGYHAVTGRVTSLTYASGQAWTYEYQRTTYDPEYSATEWAKVRDPLNNETYHWVYSGVPSYVIDPLGRTTRYTYVVDRSGLVDSQTNPELDSVHNSYDALDHLTEVRRIAKPGSGVADVVTSATYQSNCATSPTCDKPLTKTDARGNVTTFTYDATHGGVLTETSPAVGGLQAVKRYAYAQRYAWLSNGAGGYLQAASPIWLLSEQRSCRTTATVGNACAGGSADEVVTSYDYGPNSGPNNLLLRGVTVTADGQALRACYGYDANGNRIWETKPRAGLGSCS